MSTLNPQIKSICLEYEIEKCKQDITDCQGEIKKCNAAIEKCEEFLQLSAFGTLQYGYWTDDKEKQLRDEERNYYKDKENNLINLLRERESAIYHKSQGMSQNFLAI